MALVRLQPLSSTQDGAAVEDMDDVEDEEFVADKEVDDAAATVECLLYTFCSCVNTSGRLFNVELVEDGRDVRLSFELEFE